MGTKFISSSGTISCILVLIIVISKLLVQEAFAWETRPLHEALICVKQNCNQTKEAEEVKNGKAVCSEDEVGTKIGAPRCTAECMGVKIPKDQKKCFCDSCNGISKKFQYFCEKPGAKHIPEEKCESTVCQGSEKIKWRGEYCKSK